ncbi:hypothetical protein CDE72_005473 [Escherichia coli]|nr:hypothetical protein [Escherichia coli]
MNSEEMNRRISRLENEIAELNKKLSVLVPSDDEKKRRDEQYAAFYDYCRKVMNRNLAECFRIQKKQRALCK